MEAARWCYTIVSLTGTGEDDSQIDGLAAEGWEPCMMSGDKILLRRDATGANHEKGTEERADILTAINDLKKHPDR